MTTEFMNKLVGATVYTRTWNSKLKKIIEKVKYKKPDLLRYLIETLHDSCYKTNNEKCRMTCLLIGYEYALSLGLQDDFIKHMQADPELFNLRGDKVAAIKGIIVSGKTQAIIERSVRDIWNDKSYTKDEADRLVISQAMKRFYPRTKELEYVFNY